MAFSIAYQVGHVKYFRKTSNSKICNGLINIISRGHVKYFRKTSNSKIILSSIYEKFAQKKFYVNTNAL